MRCVGANRDRVLCLRRDFVRMAPSEGSHQLQKAWRDVCRGATVFGDEAALMIPDPDHSEEESKVHFHSCWTVATSTIIGGSFGGTQRKCKNHQCAARHMQGGETV